MATDDPEGFHGELVDRLIEAVNIDFDRTWFNLGSYLVAIVGGAGLVGMYPDTGEEPVPGSVGEERRRTRALVSREVYLARIKARLLALVRSGIAEDFLVRNLRNELTKDLQRTARTEEGDMRREELRESLERHASDPLYIVKFREHLAKRDPEAANLTNDEIAARLRDMASSPLMNPLSREDAERRWAAVETWNQRAESISDAAINTWFDRYLRRATEGF